MTTTYELQGIEYTLEQVEVLRKIEEEYAKNIRDKYNENIHIEWLKEPSKEDMFNILNKYKNMIARVGSSVEEIMSKPFDAQRFRSVMETLTYNANLSAEYICQVCGAPMMRKPGALGKRDLGLRCSFNTYHYIAEMAVINMTAERADGIFAGTWLEDFPERLRKFELLREKTKADHEERIRNAILLEPAPIGADVIETPVRKIKEWIK